MQDKINKELEREEEDMDAIIEQNGFKYTGKEIQPQKRAETESERGFEAKYIDPLSGLGFGFEAYWLLLRNLIAVFLVLTVMFTPMMIMYGNAEGLKGARNYANSIVTLGNVGFSKAACLS